MTANEMRLQVLVQYEKLTSGDAPGIQDSQMGIMLTNAQWLFIQSRLNPSLNSKKEVFEETEIRSQGLSALIKDSQVSSVAQPITLENLRKGTFFDLPLDFMYAILERAQLNQIDCALYPSSYFQGEYGALTTYSINQIVLYNDNFYQSLINSNNTIPTNTDNWEEIEGAEVPIYVISHNEYSKNINNPFKKPYFDGHEGLVWRMVYKRDVSGYNDPTTITNDGYLYITSQTPKLHELITDGTFEVLKYKLRYLKIPREIVVDTTTVANQRHCELDESTHQSIIDICVKLLQQSLNQPTSNNIPSMENIE